MDVREIVMAKKVALSWLEERMLDEVRVQVFGGKEYMRKLPILLKSFRDGKFKVSGVQAIEDLGILEGYDSMTIWSSNVDEMKKLASWLESKGLEIYGV